MHQEVYFQKILKILKYRSATNAVYAKLIIEVLFAADLESNLA